MPRFVVLVHNHPVLHWDFMLEEGATLRTWRLEQPPDASPQIAAEPLAAHRLEYLDYEGPVSGGRGEVSQYDCGDYTAIERTSNRVEVRLAGGKLSGRAIVEREHQSTGWSFYFLTE